jgi:hypothetical protein
MRYLLLLSLVGCIGSQSARAEVLELEARQAQLSARIDATKLQLAKAQALMNATKQECKRPRLTIEAPSIIVKPVGEEL